MRAMMRSVVALGVICVAAVAGAQVGAGAGTGSTGVGIGRAAGGSQTGKADAVGTRMARLPDVPRAAEVIGVRQQGFKRMGAAFKLIHNELSSSSPDAARIAAAAADIKATTDVIATWFPAGSGPESGLKTHAKAEIWSDSAGFAATRAAFVRQAEKTVRQLTDARERGAWKDSSAALGQACKDCHDSYRVKG